MDDLLTGLGLNVDHVLASYTGESDEIGLDAKLNELTTRLINTRTTFEQTYPIMNFYLVSRPTPLGLSLVFQYECGSDLVAY